MDQCQCGLIIFAIIELFDKNMVSSDWGEEIEDVTSEQTIQKLSIIVLV